MTTSTGFTAISRRLYRSLLSARSPYHYLRKLPRHFSTTNPLSDSDESSIADSDASPDSSSEQQHQQQQRQKFIDRPLEGGLDVGIYRAILVGEAGLKPLQKKLRSGTVVTLLSIGTGGIRNNRRPLEDERPSDYANRCAIQWHRVCIYPQRLGNLAMKSVIPGTILYVEGNLETKLFSDPVTGLVRRVREIAIRRNGRIVFINQGGGDDQQKQHEPTRSIGYY
ncbi:hypothetical protein PIB30_052271 [Stylosanthes scabra]|uniref:Single-stranded DNA-binding protein, mitochondrial n=1 Tax=Stylosanthes scabra TaxID=79078 RepID=A0ABU6XJI7_9FABA|nr:hypothetical protein [Stylosanthes scabra]